MTSHTIPGKWYGQASLAPLRALKAFANSHGGFVLDQQNSLGSPPVFKAHPGTRLIFVTDFVAAQFLQAKTPTLVDRDPQPNFGMAHSPELMTGGYRPPLLDSGRSHRASRILIQTIINQYQTDLPGILRDVAHQFGRRWVAQEMTHSLNLEIRALASVAVWRCLFAIDPPIDALLTLLEHQLHASTDTMTGKLAAKALNRIPASAVAAKELIHDALLQSPRWQDFVKLASSLSVPVEALSHILTYSAILNASAIITLIPTLLTILKHPELRAEIIANAPEDGFDLEAIDSVPFLEDFMTEAIRLFPAPIVITRYAKQPFNLPTRHGEYSIEQNELMCIFRPLVNRDPICYPDPYRFNPGRYQTNPELRGQTDPFLLTNNGNYGCAAAVNRMSPQIWKSLLIFFARDTEWTPAGSPIVSLDSGVYSTPNDWHFSSFSMHRQQNGRGQ